jgi:hypothetical protein
MQPPRRSKMARKGFLAGFAIAAGISYASTASSYCALLDRGASTRSHFSIQR